VSLWLLSGRNVASIGTLQAVQLTAALVELTELHLSAVAIHRGGAGRPPSPLLQPCAGVRGGWFLAGAARRSAGLLSCRHGRRDRAGQRGEQLSTMARLNVIRAAGLSGVTAVEGCSRALG
jgi:hypothetical protein